MDAASFSSDFHGHQCQVAVFESYKPCWRYCSVSQPMPHRQQCVAEHYRCAPPRSRQVRSAEVTCSDYCPAPGTRRNDARRAAARCFEQLTQARNASAMPSGFQDDARPVG